MFWGRGWICTNRYHSVNGKVIAKKYYESKERPQEQARNWHINLSEKKREYRRSMYKNM